MTTIVSQQTLDSLKGIGLNLYERKLYVALLSRGNSTAGQLAEMVNVPRSRSYDVLESLAEKGFVIVQTGKPLKYIAIAPAEALVRAQDKLKDKMQEGVKTIENFKQSQAINELKTLHTQGVSLVDVAELSGSIKGKASINQQIKSMLGNAKSRIEIITTAQGLTTLYENRDLLKKISNKGVGIRIVTPFTPETDKIIKEISKYTSVKNSISSEKVPMGRIYMVDGKEVIMGLTDEEKTHESQHISFWTASDHFTKNFVQSTFELVWKQLE